MNDVNGRIGPLSSYWLTGKSIESVWCSWPNFQYIKLVMIDGIAVVCDRGSFISQHQGYHHTAIGRINYVIEPSLSLLSTPRLTTLIIETDGGRLEFEMGDYVNTNWYIDNGYYNFKFIHLEYDDWRVDQLAPTLL